MKIRTASRLSVLLLVVLFAASALLVYFAVHNIAYALIFGFVNIIGATFPPSPKLIDAANPFVFYSLLLGIMGSVVLTIIFTSLFYQILSSKSISEWLAKPKAMRMRQHVIMTPINGISLELANKLSAKGMACVLIDIDRTKVRQAIRTGYVAIAGDASESATLREAGIGSASALLSLYEEDIKNAFITIAAKAANDKCSVIARAKRTDDISRLQRAGAKRIILPEAAIGEEIASYIASAY
ncbi:MAG: NAD(P)-binding protein [Candidatus Micrarchaeaceae archaeon]